MNDYFPATRVIGLLFNAVDFISVVYKYTYFL